MVSGYSQRNVVEKAKVVVEEKVREIHSQNGGREP
jgi:hypothetical protein